MGVCVLGLHCKNQKNKPPLVMDRAQNVGNSGHVIDIVPGRPVNEPNSQQNEDIPSTSVNIPVFQHSFNTTNGTNARNTSFARRGNNNGTRRSPLNSGYWISIELVITVSQIIAAIVVLSLSRHEHPHAPLFTWVIGYASGCVATLPLLFWRFYFRNQTSDQDPSQRNQGSTPTSLSAIATSFTSSSSSRNLVDTDNTTGTTRPISALLRARYVFLDKAYTVKYFFFTFFVWLVVF